MSEISLDVDLRHPPERVWRALTDRRLLDEWFMQSDMEPREGATFRAFPLGIGGFTGPFEIDLIEVAAPRLLRMRMRGEQLHADMAWEIEATHQGSRLRVSQTGFLGVNGTLRRRELRRSYQRMFAESLPGVLDRVAIGEVDLGGGDVEVLHSAIPRQREQQLVGTAKVPTRPATPPLSPLADAAPLSHDNAPVARDGDDGPIRVSPVTTPPPPLAQRPVVRSEPSRQQPQGRGRRRALAVVITLTMITALVGWLWVTRPRASDPVSGPQSDGLRVPGQAVQPGDGLTPSPVSTLLPLPGSSGGTVVVPGGDPNVTPSAPSASTSPGQPSASPQPGQSGGATPVPLTATYTTQTSHGLLGIGYVAKVTTIVRNPGSVGHDGWTVVMTIPDGAEIDNKSPNLVSIAISGGTVTITPTAQGRSVAGGATVTFVFQFSGGSLLGLGTGSVKTCTVDGKACGGS